MLHVSVYAECVRVCAVPSAQHAQGLCAVCLCVRTKCWICAQCVRCAVSVCALDVLGAQWVPMCAGDANLNRLANKD